VAKTVANQEKCAIAILTIIRTATKGMVEPAITHIIKEYGRDPFLVLVSCILSLRTKDTVSLPASRRLFAHAKTAKEMLLLPTKTIESLIYSVGFYHQKTKQIHALSAMLIASFKSTVPHTEKELLSLPGVGRKTANLVLSAGFDIPAICVDTHVHRISNRLGLVATTTPEETEIALKKLLPKKYWAEYNKLMVMFGQNVCVPISPFCSTCPVRHLCPKIGVTKSR
jgi:endonuclease III